MSNFPIYPAVLFMDDGEFGIMFPDLPGCLANGASLDDAIHRAGESLMNHLEMLSEQGAYIPTATPKDKVSLPASFGREQYSVIMVSPNINYYQDIPPHW